MSRARNVANLGADTTNLEDISSAYDAGALSNRNKIINGAMVIDQRNGGSSVTASDNGYTLDRWVHRSSGAGAYTVQKDATVPAGAGFTNSLKATVTTADTSIAAGDIYSIFQKIEGYNASDLMWGTANAKPATMSFWVRSSHTGTYSVGFANIDANRGYAATYTISAADTWEYKTITVPGDTTGTWLTNNGCKIQAIFCLACGTDRTEPAGSWAAANVQGADGTFNWMANNGATFYLTGVQLEVGSVATPFEHRSYGQELALCQRYAVVLSGGSNKRYFIAGNYSGTSAYPTLSHPVTMRAAPTLTVSSAGHFTFETFASAQQTCTGISANEMNVDSSTVTVTVGSSLSNGGNVIGSNASAKITLSAEL